MPTTCRLLALLPVGLLVASAWADDKKVDPEPKVNAATVQGTVTYKGQLLSAGTITFHPEKGKKTYSGKTELNGKYLVKDMPAGKMRVTVEMKQEKGKVKGIVPVMIPAKYADVKTSGLTVEVRKGKNTADLDLN